MKQIDMDINEAKDALVYVNKRVPEILENIEIIIKSFNQQTNDSKYWHLSSSLAACVQEITNLAKMEQQNRGAVEMLEQIKEEDY